jgi:tRNA threonylcarbamoyladenosine biosynthesis protein TsaE
MEWLFRLSEIKKVAEEFWRKTGEGKVIAFHGKMGAGKTTFIHALCDVKQVSSPVGSPTFSLINQYEYPAGRIFHIDLFRLNDEQEAIRAGVEDSLYSGDTCLLEWPDKAPGILPENSIHADIEAVDDEIRRLRIRDK